MNHLDKPIRESIARLLTRYPTIREIWLFGSRANSTDTPDSDYDLFLFADGEALEEMKKDSETRGMKIDLQVVTDGNYYEQPWVEDGYRFPKNGHLEWWGWHKTTQASATYQDRDGVARQAIRIYVKG